MDPFHFTDSNDSESSEDDFTGFNSEELQVAFDKHTEQNNRTYSSDVSSLSSESDDEIDTDTESSGGDRDESDDNVDVDPSDVPDLHANPIEWTEDFHDIYVPAFNCPSGPNLPADWNPKSTPLDYFKLFMTDDLLKDIVNYTNQYARMQIAKRCTTQPNYVDQEWPLNDLTISELFAYIGVNVILSVNPFRQ